MKQSNYFFKLVPVLLAFCLFLGTMLPQTAIINAFGSDYSEDYDNLSPQEKQAVLEQKLKEVNSKLSSLSKQSKETEEYINTLDEKIKYLQSELTLSKQQMETSKTQITNLEKQYSQNEKSIADLQIEIKDIAAQSADLQEKFDVKYELYSNRAKAMYESGNMSTLEMLLTCDDISTLFTRLEMIKRVSKADKELLESLRDEGDKLISVKQSLQTKKDTLASNQKNLIATKETLNKTLSNLENQQADYAQKQKSYESQKAESDALLLKIQHDTQTYSEFRNQDQKELEEVNADIEAAAEAFIKQMEEQEKKTTTTTSTTKKQTTTEKNNSTTNKTTTSTTKKTTTASNKLQMTYPVPSHTKITTDYGSAGYAGHTGVDFACPSNSKVVAAESGYVLISKDLTNSDGSYRSYGRYIVIAHDKKNSSGNYVYTLYAHNSSRVVSEGQYVKKGQLIAYSGSTGNSTGPHCHFEVRTPDAKYEHCVNPKGYLP